MPGSPSLLARLRRWLNAPGDVPLVCEIAADYVAALRQRSGRVEAWAVRPLPPGAVQPAALGENIADRARVEQALEEVVSAVGNGQRQCALLVPDLLARVAVLEFDHLPDKPDQAEGLLRWRLGKDMPFDMNHAVLSYQKQPGREAGLEVLVAACLRPLLRQYEECVEKLGLQPGRVTLSTVAAAGWVPAEDEAPRLLVKRDRGSLGLAIVQGSAVRLLRAVPLVRGTAALDGGADFEKIYPAVVYFQDRWGVSVREALLFGAGNGKELAQQLTREIGCPVTELQPAELDLPPSSLSGAAPDARLLPALAWLRGEAA